ncbi:uncharacterized protein LOC116337970 isoform X3 [Contarinia nasturtii]|uniref:uncharacterized protein LOC116337970 isoform X3 n=1 Tax=Contarinia nasturtii TaxID=265458 RepID=UPI0012D44A27|nr:uncharacterized protein LOC116337970 isoform X3 [Contarinia nasturtii]
MCSTETNNMEYHYERCESIKLKKVLGLTVCSNAALDVSPTTGVIAYPAGCTVVLFNSKKLTQAYLLNTSRKSITAIAYSQCGRYIATGECGQNPAIKVWELDTSAANGNIELPGGSNVGGVVIAEFLGHKYATSCITFSPNGKYLVSVGSQHDMIVNVFDWRQNLKIASNKVSAKVCSVCFSEDGNYFVTVGNRHVKYWYLEGSRKYKEPIPLMGRSAILGELRNNDFCAVACGKGSGADSTYAITRNGQLVEFNSRRLLDKWVDCRTTSANCLCTSSQYIFVGCAESIIRVFNAETLEYLTTLPRTHYLGVDVAQGVHINHITSAPPNSKYPDTIAMVFDDMHDKLTCVYNDHSLYIWDLRNIQRVGKSHSFLYHSACIWGVETVPYNTLKNHLTHNLPMDCFLTCSSDDTIRVWGIDGCETNEVYRKNIYSKDLLKLLYIDSDMSYIKDMDNPILNMEKSSSYDGRNGVRCIKVSPERSHLATGDRSGNIRIYHLGTLKLLTTIEAHDSEVLCLEYTNEKIERRLLASASRDRLIHIFDVDIGYQILQTLDDHSSSITSVKFIGSGLAFQMVSCGADKSIIFRNFQQNQFLRGNNCSGKTTLYDMEVDSNNKHILTACQDRNIRIYGTQNAKHTKTFKGSHSDEGSLIKLSLDLSGIYIATSCTDKTLSVYDYYSTECMARMYGHSELVTGLKFTNDCKHLISASGDGCIFIWQVPHDMIVTMQARLSQQAIRSGGTIPRPITSPTNNEPMETPYVNHKNARPLEPLKTPTPNYFAEDIPITPGYRFSDVGQLPQWAKKKTPIEENAENALSSSPSHSNQPQPKTRGRWAQKKLFEPDELRATSPGDATVSSTTPPISAAISYNIPIIQTNHHNNNQTSDYNSASSKDIYTNTYLSEDSSIDSGVENRRDLLLVNKNTPKNSLQFESNTEHDGDIEDISDGERTSSDHGMTFYPNVPGTPTGDFKVNAMNEEELRKSVRRQKFEKQGLSLTTSQSGTNTGTGTSDDEDDASTPSGDNAERSLASTLDGQYLGGSNENIPLQQSSSFLQAALDGPGSLSDRGDRTRRSISSKHNNGDVKTNYTKSFANSKKEELMKVINEAKQKLENGKKSRIRDANTIQTQTIHEVGYRSTLRASQSISDLSHTANLDRARAPNRIPPQDDTNPFRNTNYNCCPSNYVPNHYYHHGSNSNYLNCAAPKSVLTHNCQMIRQIQRDYPPYPTDVGIYYTNAQTQPLQPAPSHPYYNAPYQMQTTPPCSSPQRSVMPTMSNNNPFIRPNVLDLTSADSKNSVKIKGPKHPGILKNYKSCPVSPVHEEIDWTTIDGTHQSNANNMNSKDADHKRHSMYSDDAKTILDMIHADTEKMIAEITKKYGDLDVDKPLPNVDNATTCTSNRNSGDKDAMQEDEDGSFSSDSLEDCSLDLDYGGKCQTKTRKSICRKKHRKNENISMMPTRSVSDYFIYDEFYLNQNRNVSLSDILNDDNDKQKPNYALLNTQRHSSASFFLAPERKSQESLISDDMSGCGVSYCNSMESILSDESECKSAPLEVLFTKTKRELLYRTSNAYDTRFETQVTTSKSYGSSPNSNVFDYYMDQQYGYGFHDREGCNIANYDYDCLMSNNTSARTSNRCSPLPPPPPEFQNITKSTGIPSSCTFPSLSTTTYHPKNDDFIPRFVSKNDQYSTQTNKSLSKEFATERQIKNSNPLYGCDDDDFFERKPVKPAVPAKPTNLMTTIETTKPLPSTSNAIIVDDTNPSKIKRSCSFEIEMFHNRGRVLQQKSAAKKYEQNLQKFEKDRHRMRTSNSQFGGTLEMPYVPHKPPVANRRSASMKAKRGSTKVKDRNKVEERTVINKSVDTDKEKLKGKNAKEKQSLKELKNREVKEMDERTIEIYVAEKGICEDDNMDSLDLYTKPNLYKENSVDSLDELVLKSRIKRPIGRSMSMDANECSSSNSMVTSDFLSKDEYMKFRDIEKKIDVINKLVELEEKKLEQERCAKELRMRPFTCNANEKGYVKSLTVNFDNLAKSIKYERELSLRLREHNEIRRNHSLPDVLEDTKYRFNCEFKRRRQRSTDDFLDGYGVEGSPNSLMLPSQNDESSSIRRACSLSDLSMGKGFKSQSSHSYKPIASSRQTTNINRVAAKRSSTNKMSSSHGMGTRSVSSGTLNQASDSDPEAPASRGGIMRPTIASQNRMNGASSSNNKYNSTNKTAAAIINRRRGLTSSVSISSGGHDDSSSEEAQTNTHKISNNKPVVPPRPRGISGGDFKRNGMPNVTTNGKPNKTNFNEDVPCKDNDIANADLNSQLISNIISQLMGTTNSVMQLHQRLKNSEESSNGSDNRKQDMLKELENAVMMTQSMLTKITLNKPSERSGHHVTFAPKTETRTTLSSQQNGEYTQMMDKCTDILQKVQKHVQNNNI